MFFLQAHMGLGLYFTESSTPLNLLKYIVYSYILYVKSPLWNAHFEAFFNISV